MMLTMPLPSKLMTDLRKPPGEHVAVLRQLIATSLERHPSLRVDSQSRYSGLYYRERPVVYLDPQKHRILVGFFHDHLRWLNPPPCLSPARDTRSHQARSLLANWNPSKGGLNWYAIDGAPSKRPALLPEFLRMIDEVHRRHSCGN